MAHSNQTLICHLKMTLNDGSVAEDTTQTKKPVQLVLGNQSLSPAFEKALHNPVVGDVRTFKLEPEDAFGQHDKNQVHPLPKSIFSVDSGELKEGAIMMFEQNTGSEVLGVVNKIEAETVWVDFNHPLAGHVVAFKSKYWRLKPIKPELDIVLANPVDFIAGVDRAILIVERALELFGAPVYVRHEVVHNRYVVEQLKQQGAVFVQELDEVPAKVW